MRAFCCTSSRKREECGCWRAAGGHKLPVEQSTTKGRSHSLERKKMAKTYKAVEVAAPGSLRTVERPIPEPGEEQVLIRVEACGICHTDALTIEGQFPGLSLPG